MSEVDWGLAACKDEPTDLFFAPIDFATGHFTVHGNTWYKRARAICADCPIREACNDYAVEHGCRHGFWGGHGSAADRTKEYHARHQVKTLQETGKYRQGSYHEYTAEALRWRPSLDAAPNRRLRSGA